jgi:hypothetical protein
MSKLFAKVKEEIIAVLPPTIFFFITLHLVAIVRVLMLKGSGIVVSTPLQVTVAALILGKAVLIADLLPFINLYPHKPLIYNVAWKTTIYVLVATLVHYLERLPTSGKRPVASLPATRCCSRKSYGRISGPSRSSCWY